jgi:ABC-2 type transport system ATP-binding protein
MDHSSPSPGALGIVISRPTAAVAIIDLLAGLTRPSYGELRVLGEDMTTAGGRAAVRSRVGVARKSGWSRPGLRVRPMVQRAGRMAGLPRGSRRLLTAAILDRLALTPWADVPLHAAPEAIARRARLAAAAVHQPELLLIDSMLDGLAARDEAVLANAIRDLGRDANIVATGCDSRALGLACDQLLTLADGIVVSA